METAESSTSEPPAGVDLDNLTQALFRSGRWEDAASLLPERESDEAAAWHALLLLAVGRVDEPRAILTDLGPDTAKVPFIEFLYAADAVLHNDRAQLAALISLAEELPRHPAIVAVAMRAALSVNRRDLAIFYAEILAVQVPADAAAAATIAVDRVQRGDYVAAVDAIDRAESVRCNDEASALEATLFRLREAHPQAQALTIVGRHLHREADSTAVPSEDELAARQRWQAAYGRHRTGHRKPRWHAFSAAAAFVRLRPIPGLDARSSSLVRSIQDPFSVLQSRRYRAVDGAAFVLTLIIAGSCATYIPRPFWWVAPMLLCAVVLLAAAATRGRRRSVRKRREQLQTLGTGLDDCRCLSIESLRGSESSDYVERHLFRVGAVERRPDWSVVQCFDTNERFLVLPKAELLLRV